MKFDKYLCLIIVTVNHIALEIACLSEVTDKPEVNEHKRYDSYEMNLIRFSKNLDNNNSEKSSNMDKFFLKDLLEFENSNHSAMNTDVEHTNSNDKDTCKLKTVEISVKLNRCGRVKLNTTICEGSCKSSSKFIVNLNYQKTMCYSCKAYQFDYIKHKIKCSDGAFSSLTLKSVKSCNCFKNSEKILPAIIMYKK